VQAYIFSLVVQELTGMLVADADTCTAELSYRNLIARLITSTDEPIGHLDRSSVADLFSLHMIALG